MVAFDRVTTGPWLCFSALLVAAGGGCSNLAGDNTAIAGTDGAPGEASNVDASPGDASACRPGDVETYQPDAYHHAAPAWRGLCVVGGPSGSGQDRGFFDACLAPGATPDTCAAFRSDPSNDACANCIQTDDTASHYGPLINNRHTFITTNVAGCIELTDPSALSCAKSLQARGGCELLACQANCPVYDQASRGAYDSCASESDRTGCQSYAIVAACANGEADAATSANCLLPTFADFYYAVVPLFCGVFEGGGAPAVDASADSAPAAVPDAAPDADADAAADDADADADARADATTDAKAESATDASADAAKD
jgi:hypothetical protein